VSPPFGQAQRAYQETELENFSKSPGALLKLRKENENRLNGLFNVVFADGEPQNAMRSAIVAGMKEKLKMPHLEERLIPQWGVGCRRLTPGFEYLECLTKGNVEVVFGRCDEITASGVLVKGEQYELDVLICASGFDTSYRPSFPLLGLQCINLQDEWASEAKSYLGIAASGFPNYMMFTGPNSPVGNGSLLPTIGRWLLLVAHPLPWVLMLMQKLRLITC